MDDFKFADINKHRVTNPFNAIKMQDRSDWVCHVFGDRKGISFRPAKDKEPNWFWRKMQYLCFGHVWEKIK